MQQPGGLRLAPLEIQSTPAMVAASIRSGIFTGRFPPGSQLNEVELARELNVSRGPVREGFTRLVNEGLLRRERNRGVFVIALDPDSVRDVYHVRRVIETAAAVRIALAGDTAAVTRLEGLVEALERAVGQEWADLVALDLEFHRALVDCAGSERLTRAFEPLYAETRLCLTYLESHYRDRVLLVEEHRGIVEAIAGGDLPNVEAVVGRHMSESITKLTTHAEEAP